MIILILVLSGFQTYFQIEIIDLFSSALNCVKQQNMDLILNIGQTMFVYTILSMICMLVISVIATNVAANCAYDARRNIFHILMYLPSEEVDKFKVTGLMSRTTRGVYTEQGFIQTLLKHALLVPFVVVGVAVEISFIDLDFALIFVAVIAVISLILSFKLKKVIEIYFKAKKTYGKINSLFLERINEIKNNIGHSNKENFKDACDDSYDKNIKYQLSQYYIAPVLFLVLDGIIVILLTMMSFGYSISFDAINVVDSVVIIQYLLYFVTTLAFIPKLIYKLPKAYATSVRIEEVLDLEDKIEIKLENKEFNFKKFEFEKARDAVSREIGRVDRKDTIQKFRVLLSGYRFKFAVSLILLTLSTLCIVYAPKVAGNIVNLFADEISAAKQGVIINNIVLLAILYVAGYLMQLYSNRIMIFVGEETAYNLRIQMYDKLANSEIIHRKSVGNILSRINNDLMNIRDFITVHVCEIFAELLTISLVIVLIWTADWRMCLIYLVSIPIFSVCFYYYDVNSMKSFETHQNLLGNLMGFIDECLESHSFIKSEFQHEYVERDFEEINFEIKDRYTSTRYHSGLIPPLTTFLTNLRNIIVYIFGIYLLMSHEIQLGTLLTIIIYGKLLTTPVKKLSSSITSLETSFSSIKRVFEVIGEYME